MANKSLPVYTGLSLIALTGFVACFFVCPATMSIANSLCLAYLLVLYIFFRAGLDDVEEKPIFGVSSWLALISAEIAVLIGLHFWLIPLCAVVGPLMYFLVRAICYKNLSHRDLYNNTFAVLLLSYALFGVIKGIEWLIIH